MALRPPETRKQADTVRALATVVFFSRSPPSLCMMKELHFFPQRMVGEANKKPPEPRVVFIRKSQLELGVHLCGGNLHGVFVAEVEEDSPAKSPDGLVPGDLILEVSSEQLRSRPDPRAPQVPARSGGIGVGGAKPGTWRPLSALNATKTLGRSGEGAGPGLGHQGQREGALLCSASSRAPPGWSVSSASHRVSCLTGSRGLGTEKCR